MSSTWTKQGLHLFIRPPVPCPRIRPLKDRGWKQPQGEFQTPDGGGGEPSSSTDSWWKFLRWTFFFPMFLSRGFLSVCLSVESSIPDDHHLLKETWLTSNFLPSSSHQRSGDSFGGFVHLQHQFRVFGDVSWI